jgi:hypothetical protein
VRQSPSPNRLAWNTEHLLLAQFKEEPMTAITKSLSLAFVFFAATAHADEPTVTYKVEDVASCTVIAAVQSEPRPFGGTLHGMVKDMTTQAVALHADTLLVLKHPFVFSVLKGVAYRCAK